jgi:hypothetical protein
MLATIAPTIILLAQVEILRHSLTLATIVLTLLRKPMQVITAPIVQQVILQRFRAMYIKHRVFQ